MMHCPLPNSGVQGLNTYVNGLSFYQCLVVTQTDIFCNTHMKGAQV